MKACVLYVVGRHLLLSLDLHTDVKTNSTRYGRLVRSLLCEHKENFHLLTCKMFLQVHWSQKVTCNLVV